MRNLRTSKDYRFHHWLTVILISIGGCVKTEARNSAPSVTSGPNQVSRNVRISDAIASVTKYIADHGTTDPDAVSYSLSARREGGKYVISLAATNGAPGAHTTYLVAEDGRVSRVIPGK